MSIPRVSGGLSTLPILAKEPTQLAVWTERLNTQKQKLKVIDPALVSESRYPPNASLIYKVVLVIFYNLRVFFYTLFGTLRRDLADFKKIEQGLKAPVKQQAAALEQAQPVVPPPALAMPEQAPPVLPPADERDASEEVDDDGASFHTAKSEEERESVHGEVEPDEDAATNAPPEGDTASCAGAGADATAAIESEVEREPVSGEVGSDTAAVTSASTEESRPAIAGAGVAIVMTNIEKFQLEMSFCLGQIFGDDTDFNSFFAKHFFPPIFDFKKTAGESGQIIYDINFGSAHTLKTKPVFQREANCITSKTLRLVVDARLGKMSFLEGTMQASLSGYYFLPTATLQAITKEEENVVFEVSVLLMTRRLPGNMQAFKRNFIAAFEGTSFSKA